MRGTLMMAVLTILSPLILMLFVHMSYVYTMGLKRARDNDSLTWPVYVFAVPTLIVMVPFYILLNLTLGTIFFLEPPRSLQFTARCDRHLAGPDGWRKRQAQFWCRHFLDPFEDGGHCKHASSSQE